MEADTTFDFGNGPVPAHRHVNGGGWVADTACVADSAWVYGTARVYGNAWVSDTASVYGNARVYDNALVYGTARVYGTASVCGDASVFGNAQVGGAAQVSGNAWVCGTAWVYGPLSVPVIADVHATVLAACEIAERFDMKAWHCGTTHCRAGWVVTLAGEAGTILERQVGTGEAAWLIYQASDLTMTVQPNWGATDADALADMRRLVGS